MPTQAETLAQAMQRHQAGAWQEAEQIYQQILQADPAHADALHLLGLLAAQAGRHDVAIGYFQKALPLRPQAAVLHSNLGAAYQVQGKVDEAIGCYQEAIRLQPDYVDALRNLARLLQTQGRPGAAEPHLRAWLRLQPSSAEAAFHLGTVLALQRNFVEAVTFLNQSVRLQPDFAQAHSNLGNALRELGQPAEAAARCREAIRLSPNFAGAHNNLGLALRDLGQLDEALACYQKALAIQPDFAEAHYNLGNYYYKRRKPAEALACFNEALRLRPAYPEAHNNVGNVLLEDGRPVEALACFREALRLKPDFAEAHNNVGSVCLVQEKFAEAIVCCQEALRIRPHFAEAYNNLGNAFKEQNRLEEAVESYQHALRLQADYPEVLSNLAVSLAGLERFDEAMVRYEESLRIMTKYPKIFLPSDFAEVHWNRSLGWLLIGDFQHGWPEYEWRWHKKDLSPRSFPQPLWDGSPLEGKTILLHAEQGLGDTIQFIRYVPRVRERGGRVLVECQPALLQLLADFPGVERLIGRGSPLPQFDVHAPLLSLPGIFQTDLANMPAEVPYLHAERERIALWNERLGQVPGVKIGIGWQGNPKFKGDRNRSVPLAHFAPLADVEGVRLVSLQKGVGREQLTALAGRFHVSEPGAGLDADGAFLDTAAVLGNLDLVIASDSAIVHLAGALAVPTWVPLPRVPDWRWFLGRSDSPWYPTMRLFRQEKRGEWAAVFERMASALKEFVAGIQR
jgi:tetratricopeptide (TPR) repeat protein